MSHRLSGLRLILRLAFVLSIVGLVACAEGSGSSSASNTGDPDNQQPGANNQQPGNNSNNSNNQQPGNNSNNQQPGNNNNNLPTPGDCSDPSDCPDQWDCVDQTCEAPTCLDDGDCPSGQACAIELADPDTMELRCRLDGDRAATGDDCSEHTDCRSLHCLDGTCTAPCESETPCAGGDSCLEQAIDRDGHTAVFDLCVPTPFIECQDPDDCQLDGRTCNEFTYDAAGDLDGASCGFTYPGEASLGAECSDNSICESGLCLARDDGSGFCSLFCSDAQAHCGSDQVCPQVLENHGLCFDGCDSNDDCPTDEVCVIEPAMDATTARYCRAPLGDSSVGEVCDTNVDCASGFCVVGYTTQTCTGDANCSGVATCDCPPNNPNCSSSERVCVQSQCTELCDPQQGDAQCQDPSHDFGQCGDVEVSFDSATEVVSACVW